MSILIKGMEMPKDTCEIRITIDQDGDWWARRIDTDGEWHEVVEVPAADVRPVVRGHWITEEEAVKKGDYSFRDTCSVCGHCDWDCTESGSFNFCPNCGADMRGVNDGK